MKTDTREKILNYFTSRRTATIEEVAKDLKIQYGTVYPHIRALVNNGQLFPNKGRDSNGRNTYSVIPTKSSKVRPKRYNYMGEHISIMQAQAVLAEISKPNAHLTPFIINKLGAMRCAIASLMMKAKYPHMYSNETITAEIQAIQEGRKVLDEVSNLVDQIIAGGLASNPELATAQFGEVVWGYILELQEKFAENKNKEFPMIPNYDAFEKWVNSSYYVELEES